jgi:putative ABC transport system ATP-binding protein
VATDRQAVYNACVTTTLEVERLCKDYRMGDKIVHALRGVQLRVAKGQFVALMGASGSGKSTLLHLAAGLDTPSSGSVRIDGHDIGVMSDYRRTLFRRERIGVIFQSFNLLPTLSARDNVSLPLMVAGMRSRDASTAADRSLAIVDLAARATHRPDALSGGEQQRVAIARALINNPSIVIADEPTGNLDSQHGTDIWRLLRRLSTDEGRTIFAVTHEAMGASYADRVLVMKDGQLVGELEPDGEGNVAMVAAGYQKLAS